eukprot:665063-Karenia_brevis.AAC.1
MQGLRDNTDQTPRTTNTCVIETPQWLPEDFVWQCGQTCFEMRVDNQLLANWLNGSAGCKTPYLASRIQCVSVEVTTDGPQRGMVLEISVC